MKKSSFVFLILSIVYSFIALGYLFGIITIHINIVLGLSLTALLISISDILNKIVLYRVLENEYQTILYYTVTFLDIKIQGKQVNNQIMNIRNFKDALSVYKNKNYTLIHPQEFNNNRLNSVLNNISIVMFVLGISVFIITPFIDNYDYFERIATPITILAFAAMCLGLYIDDGIQSIHEKRNNLLQDKHILVQASYPDFYAYYNSMMNFQNDIKAIQEEWENKNNGNCAQ